jgi:hypothetical protein
MASYGPVLISVERAASGYPADALSKLLVTDMRKHSAQLHVIEDSNLPPEKHRQPHNRLPGLSNVEDHSKNPRHS